jgi:hypothetical protein
VALKQGPLTGLIQFPHPGAEHDAVRFEDEVFPWNEGDHARKFLQVDGRWRSEDGAEGAGPVRFWGEYEPPSAVRRIGPKQGRLPQWVHEPLYPPPREGRRQNTDPLVLGGFWYSNCKQHRRRDRPAPAVTQRLEPGSLVLFGSKLDHAFVVDTVYVVAGRQEYGREDVEHLPVPDHVKDMALRPLYGNPERELRFVLYRGATVDDPVDGRWIFVPALPVEQPADRFARPRAVLADGVLKDTLGMGLRAVALSPEQLDDTWQQLLTTTYDAGLVAAKQLSVPEKESGAAGAETVGAGRVC